MAHDKKTIECPNCGQEIDVNDVLHHQVEEALKKKYNAQLQQAQAKYEAQAKALTKDRALFLEEKKQHDQIIASGIEKGLKEKENVLKRQLKEKIEAEKLEQINELQNELDEKSQKLKDFSKAQSEIARLKREKDELKDEIEARAELKISEKIAEEKLRIQKHANDRFSLKLAEKETVIHQLNEQLKEAQRKAEQGSMQIQGEVQELAIADWLVDNFPLDTIEEVKKGARGADCIQIVNTRAKRGCGTIYYESKRTKAFQNNWIEKFKADIQEKNADIGVIVTQAMPADMAQMGLKDGVWVCTFEEFRGLCFVLRDSIVRLSAAISSQENKGDKVIMLYDFLTGNEFRLQVEAIVEGFTQMHSDLEKEKRAMAGIWKRREKQIEKVLLNTSHMYNSIKGIAGAAVQPVPQLELPEFGAATDDAEA
jgi:hypothetical protein